MKKLLPIFALVCMSGSLFAQTVTDIDGNVYNTKVIGTQTWTTENLKTTKYNDGTDIPLSDNATDWVTKSTSATPAYSWMNDDLYTKDQYGAFYNWYAANTGKLCPTGWHVPSKEEFLTLADGYGGTALAGIHLSSADGGDNSSEFSILITGARTSSTGDFMYTTQISRFWSSTSENDGMAFYAGTNVGYTNFWDASWLKGDGNSVRCLKDALMGIANNESADVIACAYPNPVINELFLKVENLQNKKYTYQLFDMYGKLILQNSITAQETKISFNSFAKSTYLLKLTNANSTVKSFIIVKK